MPGKKFVYSRILVAGASKKELETIHTYLSKDYKINLAEVLKRYQSDKEMIDVGKDPEFVQFQTLFDNSKKDTIWDLYLHLVVGEKEAASCLAESLRNGYGTDKDNFLADLTLAIGAELKDQESIKLVSITPVSSQIQNLAKKCVVEITQHKLGVEDREILWDEIIARGKALSYFIKEASKGHSYYEVIQESEIGIKYWSNCVEPVPDEMLMIGALSSQE